MEDPQNSFWRYGKVCLINISILIVMYAILEGGAWSILYVYRDMQSNTRDGQGVEHIAMPTKITSATDLASTYSSENIEKSLRDLQSIKGSPYQYESYIVYGNRPYTSEHVNITIDGFRLNGTPLIENADFTVWMFGSSALFGVSTADNETIPARLETFLRQKFPKRRTNVVNFGVVGYTSWQDLLNFQLRLAQKDKPNLVIFFNGINDHYLGWLNDNPMCKGLLQTGVGSSDILTQSWEAHAANFSFINWSKITQQVTHLFSNTLELFGLALKYIELKQVNKDPAPWRALYKQSRDRHLKIVKKCLPIAEDTYIRNMQLAAQLAKDSGIKIVFAYQPLLFLTKKPLVGGEIAESEHPNYNFFTLNDSDLESLKAVPSYRLHQPYFWNRQEFIASYLHQKNRLAKVAQALEIPFIDFDPVIDQIGPIAIFSSQVHFTFRGTTVIGKEMAQHLEPYFLLN